MKALLRLLLIVMIGSAYAQSKDNEKLLEKDKNYPLSDTVQAQVNLYKNSLPKSTLPICKGDVVYRNAFDWNNCFGTIIFSSYFEGRNEKYVGEIKDGKASGFGIHYFRSGSVYVGQHKHGSFHGQGILINVDSSHTKEGIWELSTLKFAQKINVQTINIAEVDQNLKTAETNKVQTIDKVESSHPTTISSPPCPVDTNAYRHNCFGTYTFANGDKYVGEWKDGKRNGQGTLTFVSGDKYVGEYKDNNRDGQGTFYATNGSIIFEGIWKNDWLIRSVPIQQATAPNLSSHTSNALENERKKLEEERRQIAEERRRLEEEKQRPIQALKPALPTPLISNKRLALVIGNTAYKIRPLVNPRNDADDVSRVLKATGFDVIDLRDASLSQMRSATRQFGEKLMSNDVGLVYYSGHGIEVNGRNYLIPVNADIKHSDEVADQALDVSLILAKMDSAKKGVNILIVDACRDDPFGRSFRSTTRGLASMDAPQGTIIAYATAPGTVAADGVGRNSPYTKHLVRAMQMPNTPIELMFKEVRRSVREETKNTQTPWENTSLSGDFYFSVRK